MFGTSDSYSGPTLGPCVWHTLFLYLFWANFRRLYLAALVTACLVQGRVPLTARVKKFIFKQLKKLPMVRKQVGPRS